MIEFDNLKIGNKIKIANQIYEILKVETESEIAKPPAYKSKLFKSFYLHKAGDKSIIPTNKLEYLNKDAYFYKLESKGNWTELKDKTHLKLKDIQEC